jgi:threonine/homoserine/homoserine lactone efflux protein
MQVASSRKGSYLTVMGASALLFVVALFVAPSIVNPNHPVPPLMFGIVLAILAVVGIALWAWRRNMKHRNPLDREDAKVSGQTHKVLRS